MVYRKMQGHPKMVVPAKARQRLLGRWSGRMLAAAIALAGLTTVAVSLSAQPQLEPFANARPPMPASGPGELPPAPPSPTEFADMAVAAQEQPKAADMQPKEELPEPKLGFQLPPGLDRMNEPPLHLGATPKPTEEDLKESNQFIRGVVDPRFTFDIIENRTRLILLKETPTKVQVADDSILGHNLLEPLQMIMIGKKAGTTVMTLWFPNPKGKGPEVILSYLVRVFPDPELRKRLEAVYKALEREINKLFPDSHIKIDMVGDKIAVSGEARDVQEATWILRIIRGNIPNDTRRLPISNLNVNVNATDLLNAQSTPGLENFLTAGGPNVINRIRIPGEQQVMLRVTVAEVSRTAARSIGLNFSIINNRGTQVFSQQTGGITIPQGGVQSGNQNNTSGGVLANLPVILDNGQIPIAINALKTLNYARSLAEPNLVALNGRTASFQSGGSFPVPVVGGLGASGLGGATGLQGVQFVPFGVLVAFTPVITDRDRIRLDVRATVSTRDVSTGTQIAGGFVAGLNSRNFLTIVEMREGQTLAVAGLIQSNLGSNSSRVPFLGNIPILNRFVGYDEISSGESELVILVTPELVRPLEKKEVPKLPGSDLFEPSDCDFYVFGRLENRRTMDYRAAVMNDMHRMINYKRAEQNYIFGPVGHTDDPNYPFDPYDRYGREIRPMTPPATPPPGQEPGPMSAPLPPPLPRPRVRRGRSAPKQSAV